MENRKIAALVELGVLCRGEPCEVSGAGELDPGPHSFSGHHQLSRFVNPFYRHPYAAQSRESYTLFSPDVEFEEVVSSTRLIVMLGVADSPEMRACLARQGTIVVAFEPDDRVLARYLEAMRLADLNQGNYFCFTGDPYSFNPALQDLLPEDLFKHGVPAFFMTDRVRESYTEWAKQVVDYFEILHYRHVLYPLTGQPLGRSRPLRNIYRGMIYDQQVHAYENVRDSLTFPEISPLKGLCDGGSAILVAAGPDLPDRFDYIRDNMDRAVVISVNNAVKPLVEAGIHPHFVVINDTSIESGKVFQHIPELPKSVLVAHCLSDLGGKTFRKKFLFGNYLPDLFGTRKNLRLHGSVISTAFSLAVLLGCQRTVLVGAQLASEDPWNLGYSKGTIKEQVETERELLHKYPQLCPIETPFGELLYTTVNFRDAALWLAETIRLSGVHCFNTSRSSILYGKGIEYNETPDLPEWPANHIFRRLTVPREVRGDVNGVRRYLRNDFNFWKSVHSAADSMLREDVPAFESKGMAILEQLDKSNVTYLVEKYGDFSNLHFYPLVFEGDPESRKEGLKYYFKHVYGLSRDLMRTIEGALELLRGL